MYNIQLDNKELINNFVKLNIKSTFEDRKEYGEVFTPKEIIDKMLDELPKEVWTNKNLKWFDPAVGIGNFMIEVYFRLMDGLTDEIKDYKERKQHILKNMLYMSEINVKNIDKCKNIFGVDINLYEGDTLTMDIEKEFRISKFDIIIGNPPYNSGGIKSMTQKKLGDKNKTIWPIFVELAFKHLQDDGYLLFIHPLTWLKKTNKLHNLLLEKHIEWLEIWDSSYAENIIKGRIPLSLYLLKNTFNKKETRIKSCILRRKKEITSVDYLDKKDFLPLGYFSIFKKLKNFIEKNNLQLESHKPKIQNKSKPFKLPENYSAEDLLAIDTYKIKEGIIVKKCLEKYPDADKRKLILANKLNIVGMFIDEGKLGITGHNKFYILGDNLELILKLLTFKFVHLINYYTKYDMCFIHDKFFDYIPDLRKMGIENIEEDEFYKMVGFTDDEIQSIKLN